MQPRFRWYSSLWSRGFFAFLRLYFVLGFFRRTNHRMSVEKLVQVSCCFSRNKASDAFQDFAKKHISQILCFSHSFSPILCVRPDVLPDVLGFFHLTSGGYQYQYHYHIIYIILREYIVCKIEMVLRRKRKRESLK